VILDVSRVVSEREHLQGLLVELDLLPSLKEQELDEYLQRESLASGKKQLASILPELLPRRLGEKLLTLAAMPIERKAAGLSKVDRGRLVQLIKHLPVPVTGTLGFKKAEVTAGGIALNEVDSRTMQSKRVPELYLAGEVLDLDGPIGGYNFQAAFSTGWLAGDAVSHRG
jgi:predicted Rossmann fold flavoprotein